MRVLHVIPSMARADGGPAEVLRGLVPALAALGIDVHVLTTDKGMSELDSDIRESEHFQIERFSGLPRWTLSFSLFRALVDQVKRADIVHVHSVHTFPSTSAMLISRLLGRPVILQPHGALDHYHISQGAATKKLYTRLVDRIGLKSVRAVAYSSRREMRDGLQYFPASPAIEVPLGGDPSLFSIDQGHHGGSHLTYIGRITRKKRADLVIRAVSILRERGRDVSLTVAGPIDGTLPVDLPQLVDQLGLREHVTLLSSVDSAERSELLATSAFFVLPSEDESFGMAVAEAMAAGCIVACTPEVGLAEEAAEAGALVLIDSDPRHIANRIEELLDPVTLTKRAQAAREYSISRFSWSHVAEGLVGHYLAYLVRIADR